MKIIYTNPHYPEERMIIGKCPSVRYERSRPFGSLLSRISDVMPLPCSWRIFCSEAARFWCGGVHFPVCGGGGGHFFNLTGVGWSAMPYVTTFETKVPYTEKQNGYFFNRALDDLASSRCRKLLALSECTRKIQALLMHKYGYDEVMNKVEVLHPPQELLATGNEISDRDYERGVCRFIFVGGDLIRKGGGACLRVLRKLRKEYPVEFILIGRLDAKKGDYMYCEEVDNGLKKIIVENSDWVRWYERLDNCQVLQLLKKCHVGLLPTRSDTYGFSVLEMQSAGVPVITSNIRALPEINSEKCGWVFEVDKNENGNFPDISTDGIVRLNEQIELGLEAKIREVLENRSEIKHKALTAWCRIRTQHDPSRYAERLLQIYQESFRFN